MTLSGPDGGEATERLFASLRQARTILVAVSGGPDSVALLHLLARWRAEAGPSLVAATVDHGLRPAAAAEAELVAEQAARLGIPHRTLSWAGPKPTSGVQAAARAARYELLLNHAEAHGATHLVTGHTLDDQAETVLMRLSRGSGPSGLAGMRKEVDRRGIRHVRPLLEVRKASLLALCRREGWAYLEDPGNTDDRFARSRWRKLLPMLAAEGLTAERLGRLAERVRSIEAALEEKARLAWAQAAAASDRDQMLASVLRDEPFEIAVRVLVLALRQRGDGPAHLRLGRVERAVERLRRALAEGRPERLSVAGQLLDLSSGGALRIRPEPARSRGRRDPPPHRPEERGGACLREGGDA